jgi:Ankyrin repeats (3 copies)
VNFVSKSHITPVMLSVENQRPEILEKLISKGANVTNPDSNGITPLALASRLGNSAIMGHLLKADAAVDDGSLHDAARELRCDAMRVLIKYHHDVDFPSDRHDGRSALAELCLKAIDNGPRPEMEEAIECLIANGADIRLHCMGKTIFHYALDSSDPISILPVLLKILWKVINEDCYLYTDGQYTYSLTKYVEKGISLGPGVQREELIKLLKKKRAADRFWANFVDGLQPTDICGAPQHIMDEANHQRIREKRMSEQRVDALAQMELKRILVIEESKILQIQTDKEIRRDREKARATERIVEDQAGLQLRIESRAEIERQRLLQAKQSSELSHVKAIGAAQVATQREIGQATMENDRTKHMLQLEYMEQRIGKENEGTRARLAIEESAWEERERHQLRAHEREIARMKTQKALLDSNAALASNLRVGGASQRQIGYVMGEV